MVFRLFRKDKEESNEKTKQAVRKSRTEIRVAEVFINMALMQKAEAGLYVKTESY